MKTLFEKIASRTLENALSGRAKGIPFPIDKLNDSLLGILPNSMTLWAAESNTGKTRILYYLYWFWVVDYCNRADTDRNPEDVLIYIYAYEMPLDRSLALMSAAYLMDKKGMDVSDATVMGYEGKPSEELEEMLKSEEHSEFMKKLFKQTRFRVDTKYKSMIKELYTLGMELTEKIDDDELEFRQFTNPKQMVIVMTDHIGNATSPKGSMELSDFKTYSQGHMKLRNKFGFTMVPIQQANPTEENHLIPGHRQMRDTKNFFIESDGVVGAGSPYKLKIDTVDCDGLHYQIANTPHNGQRGLLDTILFLGVTKSRYGKLIPLIPVGFKGAQGIVYSDPPTIRQI